MAKKSAIEKNRRRVRLAAQYAERRKTLKLELEIRNALHRLAAHITTMHNELDLLPVRVTTPSRWLTVLRRLRRNLYGTTAA